MLAALPLDPAICVTSLSVSLAVLYGNVYFHLRCSRGLSFTGSWLDACRCFRHPAEHLLLGVGNHLLQFGDANIGGRSAVMGLFFRSSMPVIWHPLCVFCNRGDGGFSTLQVVTARLGGCMNN